MKKLLHLAFACLIPLALFTQTLEEKKQIIKETNVKELNELAGVFKERAELEKAIAVGLAIQKGWDIRKEENGVLYELMKVSDEGLPIYNTTNNVNAAISTRANTLHNGGILGLNVEGQNMTAHIWDGGLARSTHQEYDGSGGSNRFSIGDGTSGLHYHSAHVTGTIIASGYVASAKGMAPQAYAVGYEWNNDISEATTAANNGMLFSNHSYGYGASSLPDWYFGAYISESRSWDIIMYNAPYYLMVCSAGNDGNDNTSNGNPLDGNSSYDKLSAFKTSKNNMVVANANDANIDVNGNLISVSINSGSSEGPTDDYRIKPDITGNGTSLYSTYEDADNSYGSLTGTSMASPNVCGTLLLLQKHYNNVNSAYMMAATLKGLALHTADDAGPSGPDAVYGWGLLNAKEAANVITDNGNGALISELNLNQGSTYTLNVNSDGVHDLIASICWTDPAGTANIGIANDNTPVLVNDLDIRVTQGVTTYYPFRLTSVTTNGAGDNTVDPYEKIIVSGASGAYTITVSHKGSLSGGSQNYALIITGINTAPLALTADFTGNSTVVQVGNTVTFTDLSSGPNPITSYSWSFEGGIPSTATGSGPHTITYNNLGVYDVSLIVNDGIDTDTELKSDYITATIGSSSIYTWIGPDNGDWQTAGNWSPSRTTPDTDDILLFNGGSTLTVTNVITQTIGALNITNNSIITLNSTAGRTLTIGNITGTDLTIESGSQLILGNSVNLTLASNSSANIDGILNVGSSRTFDTNNSGVVNNVTGSIINFGTVSGAATTLFFDGNSIYEHARNGGAVPTATWAITSTCYITGVTSTIPTGQGQAFGNFKYECNQTGDESFAPGSIAGNLEIVSISTDAGDELRLNVTTLNVGGNFSLANGTFRITSGSARTLNIAGNVNISGGLLLMNAGTNVGTLNVARDFTHSGGTIDETSSGTGAINFNGTSLQTYTSGGTITNTINFTVNNGAYLQMAAAGTTVDGGGSFTLVSGGTLGIKASDGIAGSGATGNIRVTGTRNFNTAANYIYNGTGSQQSGDGLPLTVNDLTVSGTSDLSLTNSASISTPQIISNDLTIESGTRLTIGSTQAVTINGTLTNDAGINGLVIKSTSNDATGSLIHSTAGVDARVEKYLTEYKWHFIGMPIDAGFAGIFKLPGGHSDIYLRTHIESTNDWGPYIVPVITPLVQGRGYECWVGDPEGFHQDEVVKFEGTLNAGNYATGTGSFYNLEYTTGHGLNLICNPYPSALQGNINTWTKSNIANSIWTWSDAYGNYVYWGTGNDYGGGNFGTMTGGVIPAMQSFFVEATGSNPSVTIPQNDRIHSAQPYYKEMELANTVQLDVEGNGFKDIIFVRFDESATNEYDKDYDIRKLYGLDEAPQLYSIIPGANLSVNALSLTEDYTFVNIGFECAIPEVFTIKTEYLESFDDGVELFLEDKQENIIQNLNENPEYVFVHNPLNDPGRFILHFGTPNNINEINNPKIRIYSYGDQVYVKTPEMQAGVIIVYNIMGKEVLRTRAEETGQTIIQLTSGTGYYLVQVQTENKLKTEKVFIR